MNRIITLFIIFVLLSTLLVLIFQPKTHKPIAFEDRNFKLEMITKTVSVENTSVNLNDEIDNNEQIENNQSQKDVKDNSSITATQEKPQMVSKTGIKKEVTKEQKKVSKNSENTIKNTNGADNNKQKKQEVKKVEVNIQEKPVENNKVERFVEEKHENPIINKNAQQIDKKEEKVQQKVKVLTEEEEIIAWNKWRSDLQNKLMRDSKISAPLGTTFEFSFTVDKFGTITNLKTWSSNPSYTPLAVKVMKPLLLSYQRTFILNFPEGSKRIITNVKGGFTMAISSRYSSPSDYNDYERVTR